MVAACRVSARPILPVVFSSARSTWSAWIVAVSRVTCAVTNGLPSRSAPTQLPNRRKAGTGDPAPAAPATARSSSRYTAGTTRNSVSSNAVITVRTSSMGSIALTRSCEVRHSRSTSSRSLRRASSRSVAAVRWSSSTSSSPLIRRSAATTARRRASVGCAVSTRCTRSDASSSRRCSGPASRLISATAAASDSRTGSWPVSRSRRLRMRWCSSARLAR